MVAEIFNRGLNGPDASFFNPRKRTHKNENESQVLPYAPSQLA
jgi:hypothetical protein